MKANKRFEELLGQMAEGALPPDQAAELAALIKGDPSLAKEVREHLETSEMMALSEDAAREGARFADALRHQLDKRPERKLSQRAATKTIAPRETSILDRYSNNHRLLAFMKASLALHLIWLCIAAGAFYFGTKNPASSASDSDSNASALTGTSAGSSILESQGKRGQRGASGSEEALAAGQGVSSKDFPALAKAATSSNPVERARAMAQLLEQVNSENAAEILAAMQEAGAKPEQMGSVVYAWAALDGPAALAFAEEMKEHMNDEQLFGFRGQVVRGWGSADPDAAIAYVDGIEDERLAGGMRWNLISGLADGDLDSATDYVVARAEAGDRGTWKFSEMLTERLLDQRSVKDSVSWADQLPDGNVKTAALHRVATDFVAEDPQAAAEWATALSDTEHGTKVIHEVSDEWAERDPAAAVSWLETLPDGDAKAYGMSAALTEWVKRGDPHAASEYLATMEPSVQRDRAVGGFASTLAHSDPSSAVTWAETIEDPKIRQGALIESGRSWMRSDPTAAAEWLQSGQLDANIVEGITNGGKRDWGK